MTGAGFPLDLTYSEKLHTCGYAPRAVHLAAHPDGNARILYVGCKDGTVWTLDGLDRDDPRPTLVDIGRRASGVRCLYELAPDLVLIGRNNGQLDLLDRRGGVVHHRCLAQEMAWLGQLGDDTTPSRYGGSVRWIGRPDGQRLYVSFRRLGTIILDLTQVALDNADFEQAVQYLSSVFERALEGRVFLSRKGNQALTSVQLITRLTTPEGAGDHLWFIATEEGRLYRWEGNPRSPAEPLDLWPTGEKPVLINDFALMRRPPEKEARGYDEATRGVFLATDRGVHFFTREGNDVSTAQRLSLPGLGPVCMSITHVADDSGGGWHYLWAVDAEGRSHLFCDDRCERAPNFRPSGFSHLGSQVMLAVAFRRADVGHDFSMTLAQTRRDDTFALGRYQKVRRDRRLTMGPSSEERARARRALSSMDAREVSRFLRDIQKNDPRHADLWRERDMRQPRRDKWLRRAARVSELVQAVAASPVTREALQEFLDNPKATYSLSILERLRTSEEPEIEDILRVLDFWTVSFLGVINRYLSFEEPRSQVLPETARRYSLGLLRWLGHLREPYESLPNGEPINRRFEACTRMVRKWGLFGEQNGKREALSYPLFVLDERTERHPGERIDLLTYEALLYSRGIDQLFDESELELEGRTARALSATHLRTEEHLEKWVAVSWQWGGIELFRVRHEADSPRIDLEFVLAIPPPLPLADGRLAGPTAIQKKRLELANIRQIKWGQSRILHLAIAPDCQSLHLLSSPYFDRDRRDPEKILLYVLPIVGGRLDPQSLDGVHPVSTLELPRSHVEGTCESAYSLVPIGAERFVVGLRGTAGMARLWAFKIEGQQLCQWGEAVDAPRGIIGARVAGDKRPAISQNRIWSLAGPWPPSRAGESAPEAEPAPEGAVFEVVAGCDNGEIWRLTWPRSAPLSQDAVDHGGRFELVARQAAPVRALAYRKNYDSEDFLSRVFAGGDDGTLLAWQELPRAEGQADVKSANFISLWATSEDGPVSGLHLWPYQADHLKAPPVLVIAVYRDGRTVLFDDRVGPAPDQNRRHKTPRRVQFAGNRHSRLRLSATVYASHLCDKRNLSQGLENDSRDLLGVLLTATNRGTVRGLGLHHPRYTPKRKAAFHSLVRRWWKAARSDPQRSGDIQYHLADAVYRAAPDLSFILVRWLLDPALDPDLAADPEKVKALGAPTITEHEPPRWQLPRHFRPLLDLRRLWIQIPASEAEAQSLLARIDASLTLALRLARQMGDVRMFQEICESVLKRANFVLFRAAESDATEAVRAWAQATFERIAVSIDNALERWHGMPDNAERLVRIVVAKNFLDGDTFLRVLRKAASENPAGPKASRQELATPGESLHNSSPFSRVLQRRVLGARELIFRSDPVIRLESIRAANLALLRLCFRLRATATQRFRLEGPEVPSTEIRWEEFEIFFEHLTFAAARVFQSPDEVGEALAHEYARTFALSVCACPSAAVRIANRMTETRLIADLDSEEDLSRRVQKQMILLGTIGVPVPDSIQRLFVLVTQGPIEGLWSDVFPADLLSKEGKARDLESFTATIAPQVGFQNAQDLFCLDRILRILGWLESLAEAMASNVFNFDFSREAFERAQRHLADLQQEDSIRSLYANSYAFWQQALGKLEQVDAFVEQSTPISPRALFASRHLATWARGQLGELDQRYRDLEIFQPEVTHFRRALDRLREAAEAFPESAAVQKAVVVGVLGHHLLEDLDEHVLELEEIAHALDPVLVADFRRWDRRPLPIERQGPMARRFAAYLLRRAQHAASSPKNLRILYGLLESMPAIPDGLGEGPRMAKLLDAYSNSSPADPMQARIPKIFRWETAEIPDNWGRRLVPWEASHLELVLEELHQNHRKHARMPTDRSGPAAETEFPRPRVQPGASEMVIEMTFTFELGQENLERLRELQDEKMLDRPMKPNESVVVPSSGTGLYLARLAAAVVGWRFLVLRAMKDPENERQGTCTFSLGPLTSEALP